LAKRIKLDLKDIQYFVDSSKRSGTINAIIIHINPYQYPYQSISSNEKSKKERNAWCGFFYDFTRWLQVSTTLKNGCSIGPSPQLSSHQNPGYLLQNKG